MNREPQNPQPHPSPEDTDLQASDKRKRKKKWKKWPLFPIGLGIGLLALSGAAMAGKRPGHHHGRMLGMHVLRVFHSIDLNEEQELKLVRIRRGLRQEAKKARQSFRTQMPDIVDELQKPEPNAAQIHSFADQMFDQFRQAAHKTIDQILELSRTLTPEQRATLKQKTEKIQKRMRNRERHLDFFDE